MFFCSTLSSGLNSLAAVFWESVVQPHFPNLKENTAANVNKGIGKTNKTLTLTKFLKIEL